MSTPPPPARKPRLTGASRRVAYSENPDVACPIGSGATFIDNAYNVSVDTNIGEIETTAFGDYPYGTAEPGFITKNISLSMRKQAGAADLAFLTSRAESREPFRIAVLDTRNAGTTGWDMAVVVTQITDSGDFQSAQDLAVTLALAPSALPPKRIGGTP